MKAIVALVLCLVAFPVFADQVIPQSRVDTMDGNDPVGVPCYQIDELLDEIRQYWVMLSPFNERAVLQQHVPIIVSWNRLVEDSIEGITIMFMTDEMGVSFGDTYCRDTVIVFEIDDEKVVVKDPRILFIDSDLKRTGDSLSMVTYMPSPEDWQYFLQCEKSTVRLRIPGSNELVTMELKVSKPAVNTVMSWRDANWSLRPFNRTDHTEQ